MEIKNTRLAWFASKRGKWLALLLLVAMGYGMVKLYKEIVTPPPLVYLIPESYFGPVFVFFDQTDGVDVQPDPLGRSVWVPENGVVKIRQKVGEVMGESREGYRATYVISVTKDGSRKILKFNGYTHRDENGQWVNFYFNENSKLHKFPVNKSKGPFYFFSEDQKNERMVFSHDGCAHQFDFDDKSTSTTLACGKFLIVSPNEFLNLPEFMWEELHHPYGSIRQFVEEANERVMKKKEHYKLA